jgi:uncharacterized protein with PIN domain
MLGGLAKWLRVASYDPYYARQVTDVSDGSLTAKALEEERGTRVLLTSDGGFLERKPVRDGSVGFSRVPQLLLEERLRLVVGHFALTRRQSRCMKCNGELRRRAARHGDGPGLAGVILGHEKFFLCRGCGCAFWHGSHWDRIVGRLERVLGWSPGRYQGMSMRDAA